MSRQYESRNVGRDEALLWLNNHIDRHVNASVEVQKGDYKMSVLSASGRLRHWTGARASHRVSPPAPREDVAGLYAIGDASLDLTDVADEHFAIRRIGVRGDVDRTLVVRLAEGVTLEIMEQVEA